jgi:hypothetical protein
MNNQPPSNKKTIIIGIVLIVLLAGGWYFYKSGSSPASTSSLISSSDGSGSVGTDVLSVLNSVSSIRIDTSLFTSPAYQSLVDYSIQVPPQAIGRPNPFAPTGGGSTAPAGASTQTAASASGGR